MDLSFGEEYESFRREVRAFLQEYWASASQTAGRSREFRRLAIERGYLYRSVPRDYGGSEQPGDVLKAQIIREEFERARAPREIGGIGVSMLVPTLLTCGTPWQKSHFIPPTVRGDYFWAQGYSEPGSGSDLASLRTRGELIGNEWVINGQKIWSSLADQAHYMFALVRTEPGAPKHQGISYLLVDLHQPGVLIRPLKQLTGSAEFCEVFFDGARTPADWIVGERGQGWTVSRTTLKHERSFIGEAGASQQLFDRLVELARASVRNGRPALEDPDIRQRLVALEGFVRAHVYSGYRQLSSAALGRDPGIIGLLNKLVTTQIGHGVASIAKDLMGDEFLLEPFVDGRRAPGAARWNNQFMGSLGVAIAGGTSNIQRNIIAERGLGLPREDTARD